MLLAFLFVSNFFNMIMHIQNLSKNKKTYIFASMLKKYEEYEKPTFAHLKMWSPRRSHDNSNSKIIKKN